MVWQMLLLHCPPETSEELGGLGEVWQKGLGKPGPLCIGRSSCIDASEMGSAQDVKEDSSKSSILLCSLNSLRDFARQLRRRDEKEETMVSVV